MDTHQLLNYQLDRVKGQLTKVTADLTEDQVDFRPVANMYTIRETLHHLSDTYVATQVLAAGGTPEFGTFKFEDASWSGHLAEAFSLRGAAIDSLMASKEDSSLTTTSDYILLHDAYHVGQLATLRNALDPEWSSYSIYE